MSSYISSPFELEERRLQGIVNKCSDALDAALAHVMEQEMCIRDRTQVLQQIQAKQAADMRLFKSAYARIMKQEEQIYSEKIQNAESIRDSQITAATKAYLSLIHILYRFIFK